MRLPHDPPLLALVGATAELHAGTPPTCSASVRLLDRVHFTVHRGDCVVVHHDDPAGARVLLAALAGTPALTMGQRWRGERHVAPQVRIRRCSISADALPHILAGWRELREDAISVRALPSDEPEPVVHLLRASRSGTVCGNEARQWRAWARRLRLCQGAIVAVARPHPVSRVPAALSGPPTPRAAQLCEAEGLAYDASEPLSTRGLWLRFGQLLALRQWQ